MKGTETMAAKPPAYQHYAKDFLTGTMTLALDARGLYAVLLSYQWDAGGIPNDLTLIARAASCEVAEIEKLWPVIRSKFRLERDGFWRNLKLKKQRRTLERRRKASAHNGIYGGRPKTWQVPSRLSKTKPRTNLDESSPISDLRSSDQHPLNPPRAEGERAMRVSTRKPSNAERDRAERALKSMGRCPHGEPCPSFAQCVGRLVQDERQRTAAGQRAASRENT